MAITTSMEMQSIKSAPKHTGAVVMQDRGSPSDIIPNKRLYRSLGPSPPNQNYDRWCPPSICNREVVKLIDDLVVNLLRYCDNVTLAIFWSVRKSMRVLVLKTLSMHLCVLMKGGEYCLLYLSCRLKFW